MQNKNLVPRRTDESVRQPGTKTPPREIEEEMEVLRMNIQTLSKQITNLGDRLTPVSRRDPGVQRIAADDKPRATALAQSLKEMSGQVLDTIGTVEYLTAMLEI